MPFKKEASNSVGWHSSGAEISTYVRKLDGEGAVGILATKKPNGQEELYYKAIIK